MNISIIGAGYVGLVTGACFTEMGNTVTCVDINEKKVANLEKGIIPIYEPGLEGIITHALEEKRIRFTTSIAQALEETTICFIAVDTPMSADGSADLKNVFKVAHDIGRHMTHDMLVVDKSTVPVGTAHKVREIIKKELVLG